MKTIYSIMISLFFSTLLFSQQTPLELNDNDGDGFYDIDEFSKVYSKGYNDWDVDKDGRINSNEFYDANYNHFDLNHDGRLTPQEWTAGNRYYGEYITTPEYDTNPPQYLSKQEFAQRFTNSEYYNSYDTDHNGFVDNDELNKATFNRLDRNHDNKLDANELEGY